MSFIICLTNFKSMLHESMMENIVCLVFHYVDTHCRRLSDTRACFFFNIRASQLQLLTLILIYRYGDIEWIEVYTRKACQ